MILLKAVPAHLFFMVSESRFQWPLSVWDLNSGSISLDTLYQKKKKNFLVFFSRENHSDGFCYSKESTVRKGQQIPVMVSQHVSFCPCAQCFSSKNINY